jgi:mRNA interferase RelE/StbE
VTYFVDLRPAATRQLARLAIPVQAAVVRALHRLEDDPRHRGVEPVRRWPGSFRVRAGDMRIIFEIDDQKQRVEVSFILPRDKAYKGKR